MVAAAFPIAKLGALLLRQLSKPIANHAKERAKNHPFFRKYVCMPPAQIYNWCEIKTKMWLMNLGKPINIPPLNEAMAIELGANLLGEGMIFGIAAGLLIFEYTRQSTKQATKEKQQEEEMSTLHYTIQELSMQSERQNAQIRELFRHVYDLDSRVVKIPWTSKSLDDNNHIGSLDYQLELAAQGYTIQTSDRGIINKAINYLESEVFRDRSNVLEYRTSSRT